MRDVKFQELSQDFLTQLVGGAFLTVKAEDKVNTMTVGWGSIGYIWNKPVLMVPVRYSRHTYSMMEKAETFTVSVPVNKDMKKALAFCGSKSGRDIDKIKECDLSLMPGQVVDTPVIQDCDLHLECKVVYKQAMEPGTLSSDIKSVKYANGDFHVMYYGEVLKAYFTED